MNATTAKQITQWREELKTHREKLEQAQLVVAQETKLIAMIEGGIQFGESLLKQSVEEHLKSDKVEQDLQSNTTPSKK